MVDYSQYFRNNSSGLREERGTSYDPNLGWYGSSRFVVDDGENSARSPADDDFDAMMQGLDSASNGYVTTLKTISDTYGQYADEYGDSARSIVEALGGDIKELESFSSDYQKLLAENKDGFMNGIVLDPNASRTRAEYTGAVADQYDVAREELKRGMTSQGLNPFANKGADRDLALNRARDIGGASGQAYTDWRAGFNRDKTADLQAKSQFMGLAQRAGDQRGQISQLRLSQDGLNQNILNANNNASTAKASAVSGLLNLNENRRTESLSLQQNKSNNDLTTSKWRSDMRNTLNKSGKDQWSKPIPDKKALSGTSVGWR